MTEITCILAVLVVAIAAAQWGVCVFDRYNDPVLNRMAVRQDQMELDLMRRFDATGKTPPGWLVASSSDWGKHWKQRNHGACK